MKIAALLIALLLPGFVLAGVTETDLKQAAEQLFEKQSKARVLVIGEMHGTSEIPLLVSNLAAALVDRGPLLVALEIPAQEQARLDQYLDSEGNMADRQALLSGKFWRPERSDGRRSQAMFGMIDDLRQQQRGNHQLSVMAFDDEAFFDGRDRDLAMAEVLHQTLLAYPQARMLVLTGNYHARRNRPQSATVQGKPYVPPEPMVKRLLEFGGELVLVNTNVGARSGQYWACTQTCGPQTLPQRPGSIELESVAFSLDPSDSAAYDWQLTLGAFHSSAPTPVN